MILCLISAVFFQCPKELASLGLDRLKQALQALGLKCGGYVCIETHMDTDKLPFQGVAYSVLTTFPVFHYLFPSLLIFLTSSTYNKVCLGMVYLLIGTIVDFYSSTLEDRAQRLFSTKGMTTCGVA